MKKFAVLVCLGGVIGMAPQLARGCACGCGIFDVGTGTILPEDYGGTLFVNYAFQDQNKNWHNDGPASADGNGDKDIRTDFTSLGLQYMFNHKWGLRVDVPYEFREFKMLGGATGNELMTFKWHGFGDTRIEGIYTGFSHDFGSGLTFGVKLPTGSFSRNDSFGDIDRDTELGTGSTDLLLGGFHRHRITSDNSWTWFTQGHVDIPTLTQHQYRPGYELDAALGIYYKGWMIHNVQITPIAQAIATVRSSDSGDYSSGGSLSDPDEGKASGYERVLLSPGLEVTVKKVSIYADIELPVFQDFTGNQLAPSWIFKTYVTYSF